MRIGNFTDGQLILSETAMTIDNINPATNELIGQIEIADQPMIDRTVMSACSAFNIWKNFSGKKRAQILRKTAQLLRSKNQYIAEIEVEDVGKPIREATAVDVHSGADCLDYYASIAETMQGESAQHDGALSIIRHEPLGVCAGIGAWNYPIQIACWKAAPALACGNSFIFKPSEMTPRSALILAETFIEAGLPSGVFNVIQGGATVGEALSKHAEIRKISLTGSVETGKKVMASAASSLKKVTMELGGKSALIVMADADLDSAVNAAMTANFYTQGEICSNGTRVFVHQSIEDQFIKKLVDRTENLKVGDPKDPSTQIGALISRPHLKKVLDFIAIAEKQGANKVIGGVSDQPLGNYVLPTVFNNCSDDMDHVRNEIFGPVMSILTFNEVAEVIQRANSTEFGLAAGVFCSNISVAHKIAAELEAGFVWINNYNITPIEVPFGGVKMSGIGRENGWAAIKEYTSPKTIYVELNPVQNPFED